MKKILSLVLCFVMLTVSAFAATFTDVKEADYFAKAAATLADKGILTGYPDGSFGPEKTIIRAEITTVIIRMLGKEADAKNMGGTTSFTDVETTKWYSGYVTFAAKEGIVNGYGAEFKPENPVKYEEAVTMVVRAVGLENEVKKDAADWSKGYLDIAKEKGILNGLAGSKGAPATRADVAVMVNNGLNMNVTAPEVKPETPAPVVPAEPETHEKCVVTFMEDVENDVVYLTKEVEYGTTVDVPADPMLDDYEFVGWYADEQGNEVFNFSTEITEDTTIYPIWVEVEEDEDDLFGDEEDIQIYDPDTGELIDPDEMEDEEFYEEEF